MKKTLLAILTAFVAVTPLAGVKAAELDYTPGQRHNFITNKTEEDQHKDTSLPQEKRDIVGVWVTSLGEDPTDAQYVRALTFGERVKTSTPVFDEGSDYTSFTDSNAYDLILRTVNGTQSDGMSIVPPYVKEYNENKANLDLITKDEVLNLFDHSEYNETGGYYNFTAAGRKAFLEFFAQDFAATDICLNEATTDAERNLCVSKGYLTSSFEAKNGSLYVWVIELEYEDGELASILLKKILNENSAGYQINPVMYFNKSYNCKYEDIKKTACFECGDEYQWLVVGEQASTCKIVSGVTTKSKCVKTEPTGVEDYILEFAIAAGICGIVLFAVKRKSLFSRM